MQIRKKVKFLTPFLIGGHFLILLLFIDVSNVYFTHYGILTSKSNGFLVYHDTIIQEDSVEPILSSETVTQYYLSLN